MNQPEILIVGAGGMGALFGSILHENGLKVVLYDTCLLYTSDAADE